VTAESGDLSATDEVDAPPRGPGKK
jgi:hypothetical protein